MNCRVCKGPEHLSGSRGLRRRRSHSLVRSKERLCVECRVFGAGWSMVIVFWCFHAAYHVACSIARRPSSPSSSCPRGLLRALPTGPGLPPSDQRVEMLSAWQAVLMDHDGGDGRGSRGAWQGTTMPRCNQPLRAGGWHHPRRRGATRCDPGFSPLPPAAAHRSAKCQHPPSSSTRPARSDASQRALGPAGWARPGPRARGRGVPQRRECVHPSTRWDSRCRQSQALIGIRNSLLRMPLAWTFNPRLVCTSEIP